MLVPSSSLWSLFATAMLSLLLHGCHRTGPVPGEAAASTASNPDPLPPPAVTPPPPPARATETIDASPRMQTSAIAPSPERPVLYLRPLGPALPTADASFVQTALNAFYAMDIRVLESTELPKDAYYAPRKRYRAEILLDHLQKDLPGDGFRILGLTGHDISTTKGEYDDWGILGLATIDGEACVISSFRTKRGATSALHARIRLGKTAVHEIGHTLGLPHCPNRGCLMEDALGSVATTDREYDLCDDCRARLERNGYARTQGASIPWPRPEG